MGDIWGSFIIATTTCHARVTRQSDPFGNIPQIILLPTPILGIEIHILHVPRGEYPLDPTLRQYGQAFDPQFRHDRAAHGDGLIRSAVYDVTDGGHAVGYALVQYLVRRSSVLDARRHRAEYVPGRDETYAFLLQFHGPRIGSIAIDGVVVGFVDDHHGVELPFDAHRDGIPYRRVYRYHRFDPSEGVFPF